MQVSRRLHPDIMKMKNQVIEYYTGWEKTEKELKALKAEAENIKAEADRKKNLYNRAVESIVLNVKKKNDLLGQIESIKSSDDGVKKYYEGLIKSIEDKKDSEISKISEQYQERYKDLELSFGKEKHRLEEENIRTVHNLMLTIDGANREHETKISGFENKIESLEAKHEQEKNTLISEYAEKLRVLIEKYEASLSVKDTEIKRVSEKSDKDLKDLKKRLDTELAQEKSKYNSIVNDFSKERKRKETEIVSIKKSYADRIKEFGEQHRIDLAESQQNYVKILSMQQERHTSELMRELELEQDRHTKRYNRILTYAYILTLYLMPQIIWMLL